MRDCISTLPLDNNVIVYNNEALVVRRRDQLSLTLILGDALDNEKLFFQSDLYTCGYNVTSPQSGVLDIE